MWGFGMKMSGFGIKILGFEMKMLGLGVKKLGISPGGADFPAFQPLLPEFPALPAGAAALGKGFGVRKGFFGIFQGEIPDFFPGFFLTEYMAFSSSKALAFLMASASSLSFLSILFPGEKNGIREGFWGDTEFRGKRRALSQNFRGKMGFSRQNLGVKMDFSTQNFHRKNGIFKAEFQGENGIFKAEFQGKGKVWRKRGNSQGKGGI